MPLGGMRVRWGEETAGEAVANLLRCAFLPCRRWQGVALAAWGAAVSLTARGCPDGTLECYRLLSSFLRVPAVCDLALATAAGRSTVLQVYERMLSVSGRGGHAPCPRNSSQA